MLDDILDNCSKENTHLAQHFDTRKTVTAHFDLSHITAVLCELGCLLILFLDQCLLQTT